MTKTDIFKNDKNIILTSSIVIVLTVFFWDFKYHAFQLKYLFSSLLIFNFILFKKKDIKYYLYFLFFCSLIIIHLSFININLIFDRHIAFSIIFLFIYISVLYKIHPFFDEILNKSVSIFIFIINTLFLIELLKFDFFLYDHSNLVNGLCTICHKKDYLVFDKIFIEKSHFGMMSSAVILFSFAQFKSKTSFEKTNIIFFTIVSIIFFLSLTLLLGIIISVIVLFTFRLLNKNKNRAYIFFVFISSLCILLLIPNCWSRIYQVLNLGVLYENVEENNIAKKLGKEFFNFKKKIFGEEILLTDEENQMFLNLDKFNRDKIALLISQKNLAILRTISTASKLSPNPVSKEINNLYKIFLESDEQSKSSSYLDQIIKILSKEVDKKTNDIKHVIFKYEKFNKLVVDLLKINDVEVMMLKAMEDDKNYAINLKKLDKEIKNIQIKIENEYLLDKSINATTVVHLNHYMLAFKSLIEKPLGYGFQNYKQASIEFAKKNKMIDVYGAQILMNINDGSNNFNKLLVEFGYLNILIVILFFIFHFKTDLNDRSKIFIFTIIVTQLFRAAGYFNGGFLFVIIAGTLSIFLKQKN